MPHSVKDQTGEAQDIHRGDDTPSRCLSSSTGNVTQQQSPMLRAWSDEFDPRNLTINEALFASGLVGDAGLQGCRDRQSADAA
ncbi:hypothetical protein L209DRAFT_749765 [Thermothelomyces heterothallicus CBS 203.75]